MSISFFSILRAFSDTKTIPFMLFRWVAVFTIDNLLSIAFMMIAITSWRQYQCAVMYSRLPRVVLLGAGGGTVTEGSSLNLGQNPEKVRLIQIKQMSSSASSPKYMLSID